MDEKERELMSKVVKAQGRAVNANAAAKRFVKRTGFVTPAIISKVSRAALDLEKAQEELLNYRIANIQ